MSKNQQKSKRGLVAIMSPEHYRISPIVSRTSEFVIVKESKSAEDNLKMLFSIRPNILVLFACNWKIPDELLSVVRCINLHSSMLPYGKGPAPHIWTAINNEPFGVTIHEVTDKIDCGPIIAQREVNAQINAHSIQSIYDLLHSEAIILLSENWEEIQLNSYTAKTIVQEGTSHKQSDLDAIRELIDLHLNSPFQLFLEAVLKSPEVTS